MFPDCKQEEDEEACDTLEVPANYQKQVAPTEGSRGIPWPVFVSFEIRWGHLHPLLLFASHAFLGLY